jgi:hypothetical protein
MSSSDFLGQCEALTKNGSGHRCTRKATDPKDAPKFCFQHWKKQKVSTKVEEDAEISKVDEKMKKVEEDIRRYEKKVEEDLQRYEKMKKVEEDLQRDENKKTERIAEETWKQKDKIRRELPSKAGFSKPLSGSATISAGNLGGSTEQPLPPAPMTKAQKKAKAGIEEMNARLSQIVRKDESSMMPSEPPIIEIEPEMDEDEQQKIKETNDANKEAYKQQLLRWASSNTNSFDDFSYRKALAFAGIDNTISDRLIDEQYLRVSKAKKEKEDISEQQAKDRIAEYERQFNTTKRAFPMHMPVQLQSPDLYFSGDTPITERTDQQKEDNAREAHIVLSAKKLGRDLTHTYRNDRLKIVHRALGGENSATFQLSDFEKEESKIPKFGIQTPIDLSPFGQAGFGFKNELDSVILK